MRGWLILEIENTGEGFYNNWSLIKSAFENNKVAVIEKGKHVLGFIVWKDGEIHREIDIMAIKPDLRGKGIGKQFIKEFEKETLVQGLVAVKLFCEPRNSQFFWQRMDFIKFPNRGYGDPDLTFFKPLVKSVKPYFGKSLAHRLELWDREPYQVKNHSPQWTWNLDEVSGVKPIIQPCSPEWMIKVFNKGEVTVEGKLKYYEGSNKRLFFSPFMFINDPRIFYQ